MNEIVEAMARTLFVSTYADMAERHPDKFEIACQGSDWMDVAPETTPEAINQAWRLCGKIEQANGMNIYCLAAAAAKADWPEETEEDEVLGLIRKVERPAGYDKDFGHCLAMMALGTGVSWFDDHAEYSLKVPYIEVAPEDVGIDEPEEKGLADGK